MFNCATVCDWIVSTKLWRIDMKTKLTARIAAAFIASTVAVSCSSCNLIPKEEEKYKLTMVKEDVMDSYAFSTVEYGQVTSTKSISCTYSRVNEEKLAFEIGGRKVANVYVKDGDDVTAGMLLASLDVSGPTERITTFTEQIQQDELVIKQQKELIDFYNSRLASASVGMLDREEYILAKQQCAEVILNCQREIDYAKSQIEVNKDIISKADMYAPIDGTISSIREDIGNWTAVEGTTVITIIDTSVCAFTAIEKNAGEYLSIGDSVTVDTGAAMYSTTVTEIDEESGKVVFELDEPDFSLSIGLRGNITLVLGEKQNVIRVPAVTVYGEEGGYYVYRLSENGVREMIPIEVGLIGNSYMEVLSGLETGDAVILRKK